MTVTDQAKCYISFCPGCECLYEAGRADQLTCSPGCRVKAHRSGRLKDLRELADSLKIHPASILHSHAIEMLRPDLVERVAAGEIEYEDILPDLGSAYNARAMKAARMVIGDA